jgi:flagellar hook assembly protein FlgD
VHLARAERIAMDVVDVAGRRVRAIPAAGDRGAGTHRIGWDGRDGAGAPVAAGTYFVRMTAGGASGTKRIVVVR